MEPPGLTGVLGSLFDSLLEEEEFVGVLRGDLDPVLSFLITETHLAALTAPRQSTSPSPTVSCKSTEKSASSIHALQPHVTGFTILTQ
jgi:hypothetical protein